MYFQEGKNADNRKRISLDKRSCAKSGFFKYCAMRILTGQIKSKKQGASI
jgi:hypothetical protein